MNKATISVPGQLSGATPLGATQKKKSDPRSTEKHSKRKETVSATWRNTKWLSNFFSSEKKKNSGGKYISCDVLPFTLMSHHTAEMQKKKWSNRAKYQIEQKDRGSYKKESENGVEHQRRSSTDPPSSPFLLPLAHFSRFILWVRVRTCVLPRAAS